MKKPLTILGLAAILAVASTVTLADDRGKRGHNNGHGPKHSNELRRDQRHKHYRAGHRNQRSHFDRHYKRSSSRAWVRPWGAGGNYFSARLGSVLIGSALTHSFYHRHGHALCHDNHFDNYGQRYRSVGCHRIEYRRDGSQRRVDVPLSACR